MPSWTLREAATCSEQVRFAGSSNERKALSNQRKQKLRGFRCDPASLELASTSSMNEEQPEVDHRMANHLRIYKFCLGSTSILKLCEIM